MIDTDELQELVTRLDEAEDMEEYQKVLDILRSKSEEEKIIAREYQKHTKRRDIPPYPKKTEPKPGSNILRVQGGEFLCPVEMRLKPYYLDDWYWYCEKENRWYSELEKRPPLPERFQGVDENGVRKCFYLDPETGKYR